MTGDADVTPTQRLDSEFALAPNLISDTSALVIRCRVPYAWPICFCIWLVTTNSAPLIYNKHLPWLAAATSLQPSSAPVAQSDADTVSSC